MDYHRRIRSELMRVESYLRELSDLESSEYRPWTKLLKMFQSIADNLAMHLVKEEAFVLRYIEQMEESKRTGSPPPKANFPSLEIPLEFIKLEHEDIMNKLIELETTSRNLKTQGLDSIDKALANKALLALQQFQSLISTAMDFETQQLFKEAIDLENDINDND